jgi:glycosyltransferase involved in cell wall biosynthesis
MQRKLERVLNSREIEILKAVDLRLSFLINHKFIDDLTDKTLVEKLESHLNSGSLTPIDVYLILTGQYPSYSELKLLNFELQLNKFDVLIENFIESILSSTFRTRICLKTKLMLAENYDLMDVTHTHNYPHVTGIQRVVRKTVDCTKNVSLVSFDSNFRSFTEISKPLFVAHLAKATPDGSPQDHKMLFEQKVLNFFYRCLPRLEKNKYGLLVKRFSLPIARLLKTQLSARIRVANQSESNQSDDSLTNIYIPGSRLTIIDIPSNDGTLDIYQALFESRVLNTQLVLFDFIPIFHTWAVDRVGVAGHFNKYLRIVLFADRIIGISSLVAEQAQLIVSAFKLERIDWASKAQKVEFFNLPSGLEFDDQIKSLPRVPGRILIVGSIEPRKNHLQIFHALEILQERGCDFEAIIVGNAGWENGPILNKLHQLRNAGARVERRVHTDDAELKKLLATSSLGIFLSEAEGFGLPIVEARQFGLKMLYSKIRPHIDLSMHFPDDAIDIGDVTGLARKIEDRLLINLESSNFSLENFSQWSQWTSFLLLDGSKHRT